VPGAVATMSAIPHTACAFLASCDLVSSDSGMTFDSRQCRVDARSLGWLLSRSGLVPTASASLPSSRGDLHLRGPADRAEGKVLDEAVRCPDVVAVSVRHHDGNRELGVD
jgi:hypothetical protein